MADLLGSQACMESLKNDIEDLQWAITDVLSRSGPVQHTSWKFPDKLSCELDIDDLLDVYEYSKDDIEENQVAHIALYELIIDRLVLLLQIMNKFMDSMVGIMNESDASGSYTSSIGLVVKKYWNKLVLLHTAVQQLESDNKTKTRKLKELEKGMTSVIDRSYSTEDDVAVSRMKSSNTLGYTSQQKKYIISRDEYNKSCQTFETAFIPCEACHEVQKNLRSAGDFIITTCQNQGLPSSLVKFKSQISSLEWFSAIEVTRWTVEQNKDISRLSKHFENLSQTIDSMKADHDMQNKKCKSLERRVISIDKELKLEKETFSIQQRQFDLKLKSVEGKHSETVKQILAEKDAITYDKCQLERKLVEEKSLLEEKLHFIEELENSRQNLERKLDETMRDNTEIKRLRKLVAELNAERDGVEERLKSTAIELTKEKAKNKSYSNQTKSLQGKQGPLLERIDELDTANIELKEQLENLEDEKQNLQGELEKSTSHILTLQEKITAVQKLVADVNDEKEKMQDDICELEKRISELDEKLDEAGERERLMIEYPDVNGPINPNIEGSGDIVEDMERQIDANTIRIKLLEDQNLGLRHSIGKILNVKQQAGSAVLNQEKVFQSLALWNTDTLEKMNHPAVECETKSADRKQRNKCRYPDDTTGQIPDNYVQSVRPPSNKKDSQHVYKNIPPADRNETFVVGQARPTSAVKKASSVQKLSRPSSGRITVPVNTTPIEAYMQMKKSTQTTDSMVARLSRKVGRENTLPECSNNEKNGSFICDKCDKLYHRARDLEIHSFYCTE